jgi:hypothetical protein
MSFPSANVIMPTVLDDESNPNLELFVVGDAAHRGFSAQRRKQEL